MSDDFRQIEAGPSSTATSSCATSPPEIVIDPYTVEDFDVASPSSAGARG
jgi:hypothetical protein